MKVKCDDGSVKARTFTYQELVEATDNFSSACSLRGFGKLYKGRIKKTNQAVSIKQLDRNRMPGFKRLTLSHPDHPNLVKLIGYCEERERGLLAVCEYMPLGSLEDHLHSVADNQQVLDWNTRMEIAAGAARGLEFLHDKLSPPVVCHDIRCSNILLGEDYHPKLFGIGMVRVGSVHEAHFFPLPQSGYEAPDYPAGCITFKSDVYSFGVVLLELITGRKPFDSMRREKLVVWARSLLKDCGTFPQMVDPRLKGQFPRRSLVQALAVASMCLQEISSERPTIAHVVTALNYLASKKYDLEVDGVQGNRKDG